MQGFAISSQYIYEITIELLDKSACISYDMPI